MDTLKKSMFSIFIKNEVASHAVQRPLGSAMPAKGQIYRKSFYT